MYPKKVSNSHKKDIVYKWSCTGSYCKSIHVGETSRALSKYVKRHSKESTHSAIYQHCSSKGCPLSKIDQFKVIDQEMYQITHEVKDPIHI